MYHLIPSSTNLYWPSISQYRHILTQYHQVPLIIHHLLRHSSVNWIISLFTTHLMSHAQYTWSSYYICFIIRRLWSKMLFIFREGNYSTSLRVPTRQLDTNRLWSQILPEETPHSPSIGGAGHLWRHSLGMAHCLQLSLLTLENPSGSLQGHPSCGKTAFRNL